MAATDTYTKSVRSFDHTALSRLDAYPALRQALSDLANQAPPMDLGDFLAAVRDMALTAPYADMCHGCQNFDQMTWPHRVDRDAGGWLTCAYRCARCDSRWTCGYAVDFPLLGL